MYEYSFKHNSIIYVFGVCRNFRTHFCGLSVNLKRKIAERAEIEANNDVNIDDNKKEDRDSLIEMEGQTIDFNNDNPIN
jgi:hypothetical protein